MSLIFVDVEAGFDSPCPNIGETGMTEFGAVEFKTRKTFHGVPRMDFDQEFPRACEWFHTFYLFSGWLKQFEGYPIFVSDNPAYDFQWINYWFWKTLGKNPFGHSARRIGDFYAGLTNDFRAASKWKHLRITKHDHNPVNDALGNCESFEQMLNGKR